MRQLLTAIALFSFACVSAPTRPSPQTSAGLQERVDAVFAELVKPGSPGCAVGIAQGGRTVLERGYGLAHLEHNVPITPATVFEAGSVAKQFAAAPIVMLAAEGKLSLDDPVRKHLPELDASADAVTIRQMLSHTSGLRDFGAVLDAAGWPRGSRTLNHDDVLEIMSRQRALNFTPGTRYTYNTGAYNLLAIIAERVSGESLPDFSRRRIFEPLGMTSSSWRDDPLRIIKNRAASYDRRGETFVTAIDVEGIYGNCCMLTTVGDLLRWNANFADGRVAGTEVLAQMQRPARLADGRTIDYALGLRVDETPGERRVLHSGSTAGFRAWLGRHLDRDYSVAVLCNRSDGLSVMGPLIDAVENRPKQTPVPARAARADSSLPGLWRDEEKAILRFDVVEEKIRMRPNGRGPGVPVVAHEDGSYRLGANELRVDGETLRLTTKTKPVAIYTRVPAVTPDAIALAEYSGTYFSDEAAAEWTVTVENGRLVGRPRRAVSVTLEPTYRDGFITDDNDLVHFTRNAAGQVDGFDIKTQASLADGAARLERLHFTRR